MDDHAPQGGDRVRYRIGQGGMIEGKPATGLECPRCGCRDFRCTNTWRDEGRIRRRKVCRHCGTPVTTYERLESADDL